MLQAPQVILADEPVSSLDPARAEEILALLTELAAGSGRNPGHAIVASLHAPELIRKYFTRVIGLREGVLQFDIPVQELTPPVIEALYDLDRDSESWSSGQVSRDPAVADSDPGWSHDLESDRSRLGRWHRSHRRR